MALKSEVLPLLGLPTSATAMVREWRATTSSMLAQHASSDSVAPNSSVRISAGAVSAAGHPHSPECAWC